jgi:hypothetical protein
MNCSKWIPESLALDPPLSGSVFLLEEIADILDLSLGTVMSRLFYGRKKLQSILRPIFKPAKVEKEKPRFSCNAAIALP